MIYITNRTDKDNISEQKSLRHPEITKPLKNRHNYTVQNLSVGPSSRNRKPKKPKLFRGHWKKIRRHWGKTKNDRSIKSAKERRKEEKEDAKLKKLINKQQKLFRKSLLIEIDRYDRNKRKRELEALKETTEPVLIKSISPLKKITTIRSRKIKSATTQYDPKINTIWKNRKKLLAMESKSKPGLLSRTKLNKEYRGESRSNTSLSSKSKLKKEEKKRRKFTPTFSERFVNCFYRTCCRIFCCFTIVLIVGIWVILFMPLP